MSRRCWRHVRGNFEESPVPPEVTEMAESRLLDCLIPISMFVLEQLRWNYIALQVLEE